MADNYDSDVQELFLSMMLSEPELYVRCSNILKSSYFHKKLQPIVSFMQSYAEDYNGLPLPNIINAKFKTEIHEFKEKLAESEKEWFLDTVEDFCKRNAIAHAITEGSKMLENGEYGDLEKMVKDATLVSLQRDLGTNYFADPRGRLEKLKTMNGTLTTGWKTLDQKVYQIGYGELILFTAVSGGGKSVAMQNMTLNFALSGLNVVYFTLELSEELVAKRIDAMLTGISNANIFKNIDHVELQVKTAGKRAGNIFIKYIDPGSTPNDIKAYIREFTIQNGIKPDAVVIDYMDLMHPNQRRIDLSNLFVKDKLVAEALRGMASPQQFNFVCVSACQVNRSGYQETIPGMDSMAGGISKAYTADLAINIHNTSHLRERGELEFQLVKTRNSGGNGQCVTMAYDVDTLRILDLPSDMEEVVDTETGEITEVVKQPSVTNAPNSNKDNLKNLLSKIRK